jgi:hypothetical protein
MCGRSNDLSREHTGAIAANSVNSKTFSMADFEGSSGGGLTSVGWSAMVGARSEYF